MKQPCQIIACLSHTFCFFNDTKMDYFHTQFLIHMPDQRYNNHRIVVYVQQYQLSVPAVTCGEDKKKLSGV